MNKPSAFDVALDALRRYIVSHGLAPGDVLPPVAELAVTIGVSQATLREALRAWEASGILTIRHGVGVFLQRYNWAPLLQNLSVSALFEPEQGRQWLQLRAVLELGLLPHAIEHLTPEDLDALEALTEEMLDGDSGPSAEVRYHALLSQTPDSPLVAELLRLAWLGMHQALQSGAARRSPSYALHVELTQALRARDRAASEAALRRYFEQLAKALQVGA
jgi:GntR family transcriptional repressor for pyruvate dehydrogenase complex